MNVDLRELGASITTARLHLILLPTEACNFRCVYCYEDFRLKRMDPEVAQGTTRLIERRAPTLEHLVISWFGGEPLLAHDVVLGILREVNRLRRRHTALQFTSDMTTNGSLLSVEVLEALVALGVSDYQVTFDGPRSWHDRKRVRPGGAPTFDRIWGNLLAARASSAEFHVQVRLHVDAENAGAMPQFFDDFGSAFGDDPRYSLFIRGLSRLGGANDAQLPILAGGSRDPVILDLRRRAADQGIRLSPVPDGPGICYAARGNSFVIRADGRVNKCTVALEHPANQVGRLLPDGTIRLQAEMVRPWMRGFDTGESRHLACPMKGLADPQQHPGLARATAISLSPARAIEATP